MKRGVRGAQAGRGDNSPRTCRRVRGAAVWLASCALLAFMPLPAAAQDALVGPVAGDGDDPVLAFAREESDLAELRAAVISAIERSGSLGEARAARDEAEARRNEVRTQETPTLELGVSSFRVISRDFSNDPQNFLERSRPSKRTDTTLRAKPTGGVSSFCQSAFFGDTREARRELAAKVETAARMACADSWTQLTTSYESVDWQVDWSGVDRAQYQRALSLLAGALVSRAWPR